jgi:hypothetical protein
MIPFVILCWLLYLVGKEKWLASKLAKETLDS